MKLCPECDSVFPDSDQFCELDGTPLVAANPDSSAVLIDRTEQNVHNISPVAVREAARQAQESWKPVVIVTVAAVALGLGLFLVYYAMTRQAPPEIASESSSNSSATRQLGPLLPSRPSPVSSASPSLEPSASPSAMPSPSTQTDATRIELSSSAISTSGDRKNKRAPVIIRLTDGAVIEAEVAWETKEGIWYRRGGVVTLLDPKQVKTIEQVATATPQPSTLQSPPP